MIGTFVLCGLGLVTLGSAFNTSYLNNQKRKEALKKGDVYYIDRNNKFRSTRTNEIVMDVCCDMRHNGHHTLAGCESNRIYCDYTIASKEKANAEAKANGKKYVWREYPAWYGCGIPKSNIKTCFRPYDPEKEMAYKIEMDALVLTRYIKTYFLPPKECAGFSAQVSHREYLTRDEAEPWIYGGANSRFFM